MGFKVRTYEKAKHIKCAKSSIKLVKVKVGTVEEFFSNAKDIMRAADRGEPIKPRCATLTVTESSEMLQFFD